MSLQATISPGLDAVSPAEWDALCPEGNPFLRWHFLHGLEQHGCLQPRYGWRPHHILLRDPGGRLVGAAPCYLKANSHGEFVFDQRWAMAYQQHGLAYYPKLLCAIPYSPVNGPRLLVHPHCREAGIAQGLGQALQEACEDRGWSSSHINFHLLAADTLDETWLQRFDWQFHWQRGDWSCFEDFLAALSAKKRKNILQERAQVQRAGISVQRFTGDSLAPEVLRTMYGFYLDTFQRKGNLPALTEAFFLHLGTTLSRQTLVVLAYQGGQAIAGSMFLFDTGTLYGRYWGADRDVPGLHFELCYYQGIAFCLEQDIDRFEPGAQGEHKLARGFLPVATRSSHYIADLRFRDAIGHALVDEARWLNSYRDELLRHSPYRKDIA